MEDQKIDRRIRRTKKMLHQSLIMLMAEKKTNKITVKELTDLADVNRSTFYLYYKDIFDIVEQMETEMLDSFSNALEEFYKDAATYSSLFLFFLFIFKFVQNNSEMCKILFGADGNHAFMQKFKNIILQYQPALNDNILRVEMHYIRPFFISGCIGVIQQWLEDEMKISPNDMAVRIIEMIPYKSDALK